jgi:hypothetical protein
MDELVGATSVENVCTSVEKPENLGASLETPSLPLVMAPGLLRLPFELRLQIYYYCIPRKKIVEALKESCFHTFWFRSEDGSTPIWAPSLGHSLELEEDTPSSVAFNPSSDYDTDYLRDYRWNTSKTKNPPSSSIQTK